MRGQPSVVIRTGKLEAALARRPVPRRSRVDLSVFADAELDDLTALAEKVVAAGGGEPAWSEDDLAVLTRLEAKLVAARGATR